MATGGTGRTTGIAGAMESGAMIRTTKGSMTEAETGTGRHVSLSIGYCTPCCTSETWLALGLHRGRPGPEPAL